MSMNIAIDGPAGAGKSTIAKSLARKLGFVYVDTGAMYRAMACYFLQNGIAAEDEQSVSGACGEAVVTIAYENGEQQVFLNGENVSGLIRTEEVSHTTSKISVYPAVRKQLVELQQKLASDTDVIMDGRDIGTCVLPNAQVKIFLTASSAVRAKRRYDELLARGESCELNEIEQDIIERDERDMSREVSPLKQADDAVFVDTSYMSVEQVVETLLSIYEEKCCK